MVFSSFHYAWWLFSEKTEQLFLKERIFEKDKENSPLQTQKFSSSLHVLT